MGETQDGVGHKPGWVKDLEWLWRQIVRWPVMATILFAATASAVLTYGALKYKVDGVETAASVQKANYDSNVDSLKRAAEKNVELEKKVTDLGKKNDELELRLEQYEPKKKRELSPAQREVLRNRVKDLQGFGKPIHVFYNEIGDSRYFASNFESLFREMKVDFYPSMPKQCDGYGHGVLVGVRLPSKDASPDSKVFLDALASASLDPQTTNWHEARNASMLDFNLFICPPRPGTAEHPRAGR